MTSGLGLDIINIEIERKRTLQSTNYKLQEAEAMKLNKDVKELRRTLKRYNTGFLQKLSGMKADRETMIRKIVFDRLGK